MQDRAQALLARVQAEFNKLETETCRLRVYVGHLEDDNWALAESNSRLEADRKRLLDVLYVICAHLDGVDPQTAGVGQLLTAIGILAKQAVGDCKREGE